MTDLEVRTMNTCIRSARRVLAAACCAAGAWCAPTLALAHEGAGPATHWPGTNDYRRSVRSYAIPDVVLTDADAKPVRLRELLAGTDPVAMNFIFTTCGTVCPVMVKVFADLPTRLGAQARNLRMISISIDPDNDTPAQLKAYAKNFDAGERWKFLTGRVQDIKTLQLAFDSYRGDKMNHEPLTFMRETAGKPWVRIDGFANPEELAREYRKAVQP
jgi:protein SCO1/2